MNHGKVASTVMPGSFAQYTANETALGMPTSDIDSELNRLGNAVESAWHDFHALVNQLGTVLRHPCETSAPVAPEAVTTCPLGERLRGISYRAEEIARYIRETQVRVAV